LLRMKPDNYIRENWDGDRSFRRPNELQYLPPVSFREALPPQMPVFL
jgi:hypothetical protein